MVQLVSLLAYFPDHQLDRSEHCWQTKTNLAHLIIHVLLQQTSSSQQLINQTIAKNASALFSRFFCQRRDRSHIILFRYSPSSNNHSDYWLDQYSCLDHSAVAGVVHRSMYRRPREGCLETLLRSIVRRKSRSSGIRAAVDHLRESTEYGIERYAQADGLEHAQISVAHQCYRQRRSDSKFVLSPCRASKNDRCGLVEGFVESQIDHLKRVQTKLTLFSLQSDKCVSKVRRLYIVELRCPHVWISLG